MFVIPMIAGLLMLLFIVPKAANVVIEGDMDIFSYIGSVIIAIVFLVISIGLIALGTYLSQQGA